MKEGELVILKGQRKGRYHLEGGYLVEVSGNMAVLKCDDSTVTISADMLEHFTDEYVTPRGNEIVPVEVKP